MVVVIASVRHHGIVKVVAVVVLLLVLPPRLWRMEVVLGWPRRSSVVRRDGTGKAIANGC